MALAVGTSGWSYPEWQPAFYPPGLPRERFLAHYATRLGGCEVNGTFYRTQSEAAVAGWAADVPEAFRFAVKVHRGITQRPGGAAPPPALTARFLASIAPLGARLGALLVQPDPERPRDDDALQALLAAFPAGSPLAVELRHPTWEDPAVDALLAAAGGTRVLTETAGAVPDGLPPGPLAYVRLRAEHYDDAAREGWSRLLAREAADRTVLAFARHEDLPAGDPHAGVGFAEWLWERRAA